MISGATGQKFFIYAQAPAAEKMRAATCMESERTAGSKEKRARLLAACDGRRKEDARDSV